MNKIPNSRLATVIAVLLISVLFAVPVKAQSYGDRQAAMIVAAMKNSENDWNKGDLDSYMKMYIDSSTMMYPTGPVGLNTIRSLYQNKYFDGGKPKQNLHYDDLKVTMLGKSYALLTGKFILTGGNLPERKGVYSLVMILTKNGWKILHDHSS